MEFFHNHCISTIYRVIDARCVGTVINIRSSDDKPHKLQSDGANVSAALLEGVGAACGVCVCSRIVWVLDMSGVLGHTPSTACFSAHSFKICWQLSIYKTL